MTGAAFARLAWRLTEVAFAVNPRLLKAEFLTALQPVLRDREVARRLLIVARRELDPRYERDFKKSEKLVAQITAFLEETR